MAGDGDLEQSASERTPLLNGRGSSLINDEADPAVGSQTTPSLVSESLTTPSGVGPPRPHDPEPGPAPDAPRPAFLIDADRRAFARVFASIILSYFVACFDGTIMASSHPAVTSHFRASNSASWLSTAFLLTNTAVQPVLGRASDAVGRRPLYSAATVVFAIGTAGCAAAQSIGQFIAARAVCGLGAGGMMTLGAIIVSDIVPVE
jgi:hypothetical protein